VCAGGDEVDTNGVGMYGIAGTDAKGSHRELNRGERGGGGGGAKDKLRRGGLLKGKNRKRGG